MTCIVTWNYNFKTWIKNVWKLEGKTAHIYYYHNIFYFLYFLPVLSLVYIFSNIAWIPTLFVFYPVYLCRSSSSTVFCLGSVYPLLDWYVRDLCLKISTWCSPALVTDVGRDTCPRSISVMPWSVVDFWGSTRAVTLALNLLPGFLTWHLMLNLEQKQAKQRD